MRKKYLCAGLLVMTVMMTACGKKYTMKETAPIDTQPANVLVETSAAKETETAKEETSAAETTEETSTEITNAGNDPETESSEKVTEGELNAQYQEIVEKYRTMIKEQWDYEKIYFEELSPMIPMFYDQDAAALVGYTLKDLNGDGNPELLIGETDTDEPVNRLIFDAYTMKDGKAVQVFTSQERNLYYIIYDEAGAVLIGNEGSNGAANSAWLCYMMEADGNLKVVQGVIYDAMTNPDQPWFETYDDDWDVSNDTPIDEGFAQDLIDSYAASYEKLNWTSFQS